MSKPDNPYLLRESELTDIASQIGQCEEEGILLISRLLAVVDNAIDSDSHESITKIGDTLGFVLNEVFKYTPSYGQSLASFKQAALFGTKVKKQ
jgi:hypothetical protein